MSANLHIHDLAKEDCAGLGEFFKKGDTERFLKYLADAQRGERDVVVAVLSGRYVGYLTILWESDYPPFREEGVPAIEDFNVEKQNRRRGIGSALMDEAERRIKERSATAGISVALDPDYGPAQAMYAKRGYVPDAKGLHKKARWIQWGETVVVDDDLVLSLVKDL